jgi:hypothetical protein
MFSCKILEYTMYVLYGFYPLISSLISVDRLLSIRFPTKFEFRKNLKFQATLVAGVFVFSLIINVPFSIYFEKVNPTNISTKFCDIVNHLNGFNLYLIYILVLHGIPFLINSACIFLCLHHLNYLKQQSMPLRVLNNLKRETQFLKNVVVMDIWYILCYLPLYILFLIGHQLALNNTSYSYWSLTNSIILVLTRVQAGCNIFVFILFNKFFRQELWSLFKRKRIEPLILQVQPVKN